MNFLVMNHLRLLRSLLDNLRDRAQGSARDPTNAPNTDTFLMRLQDVMHFCLTHLATVEKRVERLRKGLLAEGTFESFYPFSRFAVLVNALMVAEGASHQGFSGSGIFPVHFIPHFFRSQPMGSSTRLQNLVN
jgi:hypothetical protein